MIWVLTAFLSQSNGEFMTTLLTSQRLPTFDCQATGAKSINLSAMQGKKILVYFYPKDNTPGCTTEGQLFRDNINDFADFNVLVLGVSRDSVASHENFKTKQSFPFDLLSDTDETLCQYFDVIKMKSMYGKTVRGIERSSFLFDESGALIKEWRKVKVKEHVSEVLDYLKTL